MSPQRDDPTEDQDQELYEDVPPRSIFAATWFRVVLVVIVLGVVGAVAVPYVLDWMNPLPPPRTATTAVPAPSTPPAPSVFDRPAEDKPAGDRPAAETKDSTVVPAPPAATAPTTAPPARTDLAEPRPGAGAAATKPPAAEPKPAPRTAAPAPRSPAPAAEPPAKPPAAARTEAKATAPKPSVPRPSASKATAQAAAVATGPYWVQVGAFKDPESARRLASKLREDNFTVQESVTRTEGGAPAATPAPKAAATAPTGADQYDVFVSGLSAEELNKRLQSRGMTAAASGNALVVKPSLSLRDAVALSKDLAVEGFKVQVRRATGTTAAAPAAKPAPSAPVEGGMALHRVRVGAFPDRAAAQTAARELQAKGYKPFIARGEP